MQYTRESLPAFLTSRRWLNLDLRGNRFFYTESYGNLGADSDTDNDIGQPAQNLINHCFKGGSSCSGLPPKSCDAFGSYRCEKCKFVVETVHPERCFKCDESNVNSILFMVGAGILAVCSLLFYIWLINEYPMALRGGISTFMILYQHAQTVAVFEQVVFFQLSNTPLRSSSTHAFPRA